MKLTIGAVFFLIATLLFEAVSGFAQAKRALQPSDCVGVRYLVAGDEALFRSSIQINAQGSSFVYLVKAPDLNANDNKVEMYIRRMDDASPSNPKPLLVGRRLAAPHWFEDGKHVAILMEQGGMIVLAKVDIVTARIEVLARFEHDINDYSIDRAGQTIVVSVEDGQTTKARATTAEENTQGFRISPQLTSADLYPKRRLFALRQERNGRWGAPEPIVIRSPFSDKEYLDLPSGVDMHVTLSPNGRYVLVDYFDEFQTLPARWKSSPFVQLEENSGWLSVWELALYDLSNHQTIVPFETPLTRSVPIWSPDGSSFAIVAHSPVASEWERRDLEGQRVTFHDPHLFRYEIKTGNIEEVLGDVPDMMQPPLSWTSEGSLIVHSGANEVSVLSKEADAWKASKTFRIPLPNFFPFAQLASNGRYIVGDYQSATVPPEIFFFDTSNGSLRILTRLNPQLDGVLMPMVSILHWTTPTGYNASGLFLRPPDFTSGKRYPLVVEDGSPLYVGQFLCDSGEGHAPSFIPGPLADAGIMYLIRTKPIEEHLVEEREHYPRGLPGGVSEAVFRMNFVESAVHFLDSQGLVDPEKVGLIGFSRGGWYAEYALAHSSIRFRAATASDNVQFSLGEYWSSRTEARRRAFDAMYGGPPYGDTLQNWIRFSVSFNLDKFRTPLLMEQMGYGVPYDNPDIPRYSLADSFEVFNGLTRLSRPVELYYYPEEEHEPDHPQARLASSQRNLDWYRFWLQDYERSGPQDPEQYRRWEKMRALEGQK
jgi:dipeptidyl aminopeptidase/acylaminoacyl peptidase